MHPNNILFLNDAIYELKTNGVRVYLRHKLSSVTVDKCSCDGYYFEDGKKRILSIAMKKKPEKWFPIFIHEYCHYLQYRDDYYTDYIESCADKLDSWVSSKKKISLQKRREYARIVREYELDCERRVVKLIKKKKLEVDTKLYIKKANAYIFFHNILPEKGWYDDGCESPESVPAIIKLMPDRFLSSYDSTPVEFQRLVYKYCYKQ
jgi:hypothetical protein